VIISRRIFPDMHIPIMIMINSALLTMLIASPLTLIAACFLLAAVATPGISPTDPAHTDPFRDG